MARSGVAMPPTMVVTRRGRQHVDELVQRPACQLMVKIPDGAQGGSAMASDEQQLARLLDEGWPAPPCCWCRAGSPPSSTGASVSRRLAAVRLPPLPTRTRQPHPPPQAPLDMSRIEALPLSEVPERVLQTARRAVHQLGNGLFGGSAPAGPGLRAAGDHRQPWIRGDIEDREAMTSTSASPGPPPAAGEPGAGRLLTRQNKKGPVAGPSSLPGQASLQQQEATGQGRQVHRQAAAPQGQALAALQIHQGAAAAQLGQGAGCSSGACWRR